jgi:uncharacterized protein YggU (UPF0235/DUF167 family)
VISASPEWLSRRPGGVTIAVKAVPRSRHTRAVDVYDGMLRVHIAAPPHQGQSDAALCAYLAQAAGVRAPAARVWRRFAGGRKLVEVDGDTDRLAERLSAAMAGLERPAAGAAGP